MNINDPAMDKFLADLAAVDFDDLDGDDFHGNHINAGRWRKYRQIVKAVFAMEDKGKSLKIRYLTEPDPAEDFVSVTVTLPQIISIDTDAKAAFALAVLLSDSIAITTMNDKIRISFIVSDIWMD